MIVRILSHIFVVAGAAVVGNAVLIGSSADMNLLRLSAGVGCLWSVSYPLSQTVITSMFSKVPGSNSQGIKMSWIGSAGSLGRILGPIAAGAIFSRSGQSATFIAATVLSAVILLIPIGLFRRLKGL